MNDNSQSQPRWEREEVILLIATYFRNKNLKREERENGKRALSKILRNRYLMIYGYIPNDKFRDYEGMCLQSNKIQCLDLPEKYHGMQPSELQKEVFEEYRNNFDKLTADAFDLIMKYTDV